MNIGTFTRDGNGFSGKIGTFGFLANVTLAPLSNKKGPDFSILANGGELGMAWVKRSEKGKDYISVLLKGPLFPAGLWTALFEGKDGSFNLVWDEPKKDA